MSQENHVNILLTEIIVDKQISDVKSEDFKYIFFYKRRCCVMKNIQFSVYMKIQFGNELTMLR